MTQSTQTRVRACRDCGTILPFTDFPTNGINGAREPRCWPCHRENKKRYVEGQRTTPRRQGEIPSAPFVAWLTRLSQTRPPDELARFLQIDDRFLYRWLKRASPFIRETTVDAVFCAAGEPYLLQECYPELYIDEEMAA